METSSTTKTLNNILEYLHDSCEGYRESADAIDDPAMKQLFQNLSQKRELMIQELESEVRSMGGDVEKSGSMLGAAHRVFVDLKSLVTGKDVEAVLQEVKRGEGATMDCYHDALKNTLPTHAEFLVKKQLSEIQGDVSRVEAFGQTTTTH